MTVPRASTPQRIRLTGNVVGKPPFKGALKHHGWASPAGARSPRSPRGSTRASSRRRRSSYS